MSVLRNVLTYMGLGPDEDYDDGYLYEPSEPDIDLTDDAPAGGERATARARRRADEQPAPPAPPDPHAQRERPDWLGGPGPLAGRRDPAAGPSHRRRISIDDDDPEAGRGVPTRNDLRVEGPVRPLRAVPPEPAQDLRSDDGVTVRPVEAEDDPGTGATDSGDGPPVEVRQAKPRVLSPQSFGDAKILADEFKSEVPVVMNLQTVERELARRLIDFASGICYALDGSMVKLASQVFLLTPRSVEVSDEDRRRLEQRGYDQ